MTRKHCSIGCALLLVLAVVAPASGAAPPQAGQEPQKKQITDPAEYNAYVAALNETNPAKKVQLLDDFLGKFPNTVVKEDALELKMVTMQQAGQSPEPAARQLLQVNPGSLRALVLLSYIFIQTPHSEADPSFQQKMAEAEQNGQRGLQALEAFKPANLSPADLEKTKKATEATFRQALGVAGLGRKQFDAAQKQFRQAAELAPEDATLFYRLGNAYISERPNPKYGESFWAFARAVSLEGQAALPPAGRKQVDDYLKSIYTKYHGSEEGLDQLKQQAKAQPFPPPDFKVMSRAEIAAAAPPEPESMNFLEIREMLLAGGQKGDQLWERLKGKSLTLKGMVVSATPAARARTARMAVFEETANKPNAYDIELALAAPARLAAGQMVQFEGTVEAFTPSPFSVSMSGGKITAGTGPAPAKKPPATKKATKRRR